MATEFEVRDMGSPSFFLGIETIPVESGLLLSQRRYMGDILKWVGMVDYKPLATLVSLVRSTADEATPYADPTQYHSFAVYAFSYHCSLGALKRVLRYVKGTLHYGLLIHKSMSVDVKAFSDSNWAGNQDDRKSTSGFVVFLGKNLVSWVCRKQWTVARSSTEAEYKVLADVSTEVTW
ncbi:uncharacterized protein LOC116026928 [Ipomoea triloba]|uniref:uncharacterized protein LOC116026928 n=1 Tax=Ipomoea triloba TaxID=35885 RepID=UPI00125E600F|nr:uncharacterized protein LOC116026928 [Ipomoea triloba]